MKPFPAGTKVIIVWAHVTWLIGREFVTTEYVREPGEHSYRISLNTLRVCKNLCQGLEPDPFPDVPGTHFIHPVKYLRKADEDPDQIDITEEEEIEAVGR